jgi:hypothetical protein
MRLIKGLCASAFSASGKTLETQHGKYFRNGAAYGIQLASCRASQNGFWDKSP